MRRTLEFRVPEENARLYLPPGLGRLMGSGIIRKIVICETDPAFEAICRAEAQCRARGRVFFTYSEVHHAYSSKELQEMSLLRLTISSVREPAAEECGTFFDESRACPHCASGRVQVGDLFLDVPPTRTRKCLFRTTADEVLVNAKLREAIESNALTGVTFGTVRDRGGVVSKDWSQLSIVGRPIVVTDATRIGTTVCDGEPDERYVCPLGHRRGLRLNSELFADRQSWNGEDFVTTDVYFGLAGGLLRPHRKLVVSQRVRTLFRESSVNGVSFEGVRLEGSPSN